jgi:23S rRNA (guanosine2251-2'-O)-methyltransferase
MHMEKVLYLIIHNVRSAYNVGAILRTADGAGVKKIYLTGYTPRPFKKDKDRYPTNAQKMIAKTALGADETVAWEKTKNTSILMEKLKRKKIQVLALENNIKSQDMGKFKPGYPCALILGNETEGIDRKIIKKCDAVLSIPMRGQKESLNVSVAAGIAMYELLK